MASSSKHPPDNKYNVSEALEYILCSESDESDDEACRNSSEDDSNDEMLDFCDIGADFVSNADPKVGILLNDIVLF